jgi:asparagine synthase (glutamine-hydrolysing)
VCGIAGFEVRHDGERVASCLQRALGNRGPDGAWRQQHGRYWLVQTRLAVIDLSPRVTYPMSNEAGDLWLLFNGEIYDHETLRTGLEARGHRFRTACDAEVTLHAFEEWGVDAFPRLNGMFALALVDQRRDELVLARDRFGIKPLVRTSLGPFAFASDAFSLVECGLSRGVADDAALAEYIEFHYLPSGGTGLSDIRFVAPGTAEIRSREGQERIVRWAGPTFPPEHSDPASLEELDAALAVAVERQLVADVNVGIFLSSGVDSSLLLAYAASQGIRPVAFTIGFAGFGDYDEREVAAQLALSHGVEHQVEQFAIDFSEAVDLVTGAFDVPFGDASAIATLLLARLARSSATVALSGTGGDELFAGYYRHRAHRVRGLVSALPSQIRSVVSRQGVTRGAARRSSMMLARSYLKRLAATGSDGEVQQYMALAGQATSTPALKALTFTPDLPDARAKIAERYGFHEGIEGDPLDAIQQFDLSTYLPGDVLMKEDRATMRFSLEARVPFLDEAVVEVARRIRPSDRASFLVGKRPLRALAARHLAGRRTPRQKRGFAVPLNELFAGDWRIDAQRWFCDLDSGLVDGQVVARGLEDGAVDGTDVWALATLASWERRLSRVRTSVAA